MSCKSLIWQCVIEVLEKTDNYLWKDMQNEYLCINAYMFPTCDVSEFVCNSSALNYKKK